MMSNTIKFKQRNEMLSDWLKEVCAQSGLLEPDVHSALLMWEKKHKDGTSTCMHARFNCDDENFEWFARSIQKQNFKNQVLNILEEFIVTM